MLLGLLFISVVAAFGWTIAIIIASSNPRADKAEAEKKLLEEKCAKLADHVLYLTGDQSLGGEQQMDLIPSHCPAIQDVLLSESDYNKLVNYIEKPEINKIDLLIDSLRTAPITGITSRKHPKEEVNNICFGCDPLVTLNFGDVSIRDSVWRSDKYPWFPDVIWNGHLLPELTIEQADKVHKIFSDRMVGEARKSLERATLNSPSF